MSTATRDRAIDGILATNAITLVVALWQQWPATLLLWPYWIQSIVIGWYSRRRILALRRFSTEGLKVNGRAVQPTAETKRSVANFFALHYGFFHLAYLAFLFSLSFDARLGRAPTSGDWLLFALLGAGFWLSHRNSHRLHLDADIRSERNLGLLMFLPYARILPMHLTIILGTLIGGGGAILLFTALKTAADVLMHVVEHRWLQAGAASATQDSMPGD